MGRMLAPRMPDPRWSPLSRTRRLSWRRPLARPPMSGERNPILTRFAKLAVAAAVATFALIAVGGLVRATDSGLGCPDWPLCFGDWLPPADLHAWIEHTHRLTAAVFVGPLVGALGPHHRVQPTPSRSADARRRGGGGHPRDRAVPAWRGGRPAGPGGRARHGPPRNGPHRLRGGDLHRRTGHPRTDAGRTCAAGPDTPGRAHRSGDLRPDAAGLVGDRPSRRARVHRLPAHERIDPARRRRQRAGGAPRASGPQPRGGRARRVERASSSVVPRTPDCRARWCSGWWSWSACRSRWAP